jgi:carboxymethylenebutenolidase
VRDALDWVSERKDVDATRIGLLGVSLGAALGVALAAQEPRIRALIDYFGPYPQGALPSDAKLPPTLILHGALDPIVPVGNAFAIETLLQQNKIPYEIKIYASEGHGFGLSVQDDATKRGLAFFSRHLAADAAAPADLPLSAVG